ncbi:MAG: sigma-E factor negative regulatory protein [Gammaproteobacteria bacterium]|nr:sigma-E factor negative regulatory protein [Gammaproteobacteria bacterium]
MTIEKYEQLSSFMDGELDKAGTKQLLEHLCNDQDLKQRWERYHVISDSMRNRLPDSMYKKSARFSDTVMSTIESEPTILAPTSSKKFTQPNAQNAFAQGSFVQSALFKRISGVAIAASVATIAVIGVQSQYPTENTSQIAKMPVNSDFMRLVEEKTTVMAIASDTQENRSTVPVIKPNTTGYSNASASGALNLPLFPVINPVVTFDPKLQKYLLDHNRNASSVGVHEIISSARIVTSSQQASERNRNIRNIQVQQ